MMYEAYPVLVEAQFIFQELIKLCSYCSSYLSHQIRVVKHVCYLRISLQCTYNTSSHLYALLE